MKKIIIVSLLAITVVRGALYAAVSDDLISAQNDVASDYDLIGKWMSTNLSNGIAHASAGGWETPATVCRQLGFEAGFSAGIELWDLNLGDFRSLPTKTILTDSSGPIDMPSNAGLPVGIFHVRLGLPVGFDVGGKFGALFYDFGKGSANSNYSFDKKDADSKADAQIYGVELRKHLFGREELSGLLLPDISLNLSVDGTTGDIERNERYDVTTAEVYGGNTYGQTINAGTKWKSDWNVGHYAAKVVISKNLIIATPYAGVGVGKNFGSVKTKITTDGTLMLDPVMGSNQTRVLAVNSNQTVKADNIVTTFTFGCEFNVFLFNIGANYTATKDSHAGYLSFRYQYR